MTEAGAGIDRQFDEPSVPMLICMAGLPGAGKSTIAEIIGGRLGAPIVSVDPIESAILSAGIAPDQPTGLAAYLVAQTMAEQTLVAGRTVIIDAVNAVDPARLQWRDVAARMGVEIRVIEVLCSDPGLHRSRLESRVRNLPNFSELSWHAVEQSLEEYSEWIGDAAELPRITLDTVNSLGENVEAAFAFLTR